MTKLINKRTKGQALIEFTVVLSLFLFLILIVTDLGRAVFFYSSIHNAVREGARYGITDPNSLRIETETQRLAPFLDPIDNITTVVLAETVEVIVSYDFETVTPLLNLLTGNPQITLHSEALMIREN